MQMPNSRKRKASATAACPCCNADEPAQQETNGPEIATSGTDMAPSNGDRSSTKGPSKTTSREKELKRRARKTRQETVQNSLLTMPMIQVSDTDLNNQRSAQSSIHEARRAQTPSNNDDHHSSDSSLSDSDSDVELSSLSDVVAQHASSIMEGKAVPHISTTHGRTCHNHSNRIVTATLNREVHRLLKHSVAPSTFYSYRNSFRHYKDFHATYYPHDKLLPVSKNKLAQFIAVCHLKGLKGINRFYEHLNAMFGFYPSFFWKFAWVVGTPGICLGVFLFYVVQFEPVKYLNYEYPTWAHGIGAMMALSSVGTIPLYMLYLFFVTPGTITQRLKSMFRPEIKLPGGRPSVDAPPPYSEVTMHVSRDAVVQL